MQVLHWAVTISPQVIGMTVHVQSVVSMMVVVCILVMHHQVLQFTCLLCNCCRAEHTQ